jgi:hypothetical protein
MANTAATGIGGEEPSGGKIWEKPWNNADLHNYSTQWSLAGDAGVLYSSV